MHLLALDPHFDFSTTNTDALLQLDDSERLVFWLGGGFPETNYGFKRALFFDFDYSQLVDRDSDGFPEYVSRFEDRLYQFDSTSQRVSCDFSDDALTVTIDPAGITHTAAPGANQNKAEQ